MWEDKWNLGPLKKATSKESLRRLGGNLPVKSDKKECKVDPSPRKNAAWWGMLLRRRGVCRVHGGGEGKNRLDFTEIDAVGARDCRKKSSRPRRKEKGGKEQGDRGGRRLRNSAVSWLSKRKRKKNSFEKA